LVQLVHLPRPFVSGLRGVRLLGPPPPPPATCSGHTTRTDGSRVSGHDSVHTRLNDGRCCEHSSSDQTLCGLEIIGNKCVHFRGSNCRMVPGATSSPGRGLESDVAPDSTSIKDVKCCAGRNIQACSADSQCDDNSCLASTLNIRGGYKDTGRTDTTRSVQYYDGYPLISSAMIKSISQCASWATSNGYAYFALQDGDGTTGYCFATNDLATATSGGSVSTGPTGGPYQNMLVEIVPQAIVLGGYKDTGNSPTTRSVQYYPGYPNMPEACWTNRAITVECPQNMDMPGCAAWSKAKGYKYFALQDGDGSTGQCFATNDLTAATSSGSVSTGVTGGPDQNYLYQHVDSQHSTKALGGYMDSCASETTRLVRYYDGYPASFTSVMTKTMPACAAWAVLNGYTYFALQDGDGTTGQCFATNDLATATSGGSVSTGVTGGACQNNLYEIIPITKALGGYMDSCASETTRLVRYYDGYPASFTSAMTKTMPECAAWAATNSFTYFALQDGDGTTGQCFATNDLTIATSAGSVSTGPTGGPCQNWLYEIITPGVALDCNTCESEGMEYDAVTKSCKDPAYLEPGECTPPIATNSPVNLGCLDPDSVAAAMSETLASDFSSNENEKAWVTAVISPLVDILVGLAGSATGLGEDNACLGTWTGEQINAGEPESLRNDGCMQIPLAPEQSYTVISFSLPAVLFAPACPSVINPTEEKPNLSVCLVYSTCGSSNGEDEFLPTIGIALNGNAIGCVIGSDEVAAASAGLSEILGEAVETGLKSATFAFSATDNLAKKVSLFTGSSSGAMQEVEVYGNFAMTVGISTGASSEGGEDTSAAFLSFLTDPSLFKVTFTGLFLMNFMGDAVDTARKVETSSDFGSVIETLATQWEMLLEVSAVLAVQVEDLTLGAFPNVYVTLGSLVGLLSARTDTPYQPGVYITATGGNVVASVFSGIIDDLFDAFKSLIDKIFGAGSTEAVEKALAPSPDGNTIIGFTSNKNMTGIFVQIPITSALITGGLFGGASFGSVAVHCQVKYSPSSFSCKIDYNEPKYLAAFLHGVDDAAHWVVREATEFFDDTGPVVAAVAAKLWKDASGAITAVDKWSAELVQQTGTLIAAGALEVADDVRNFVSNVLNVHIHIPVHAHVPHVHVPHGHVPHGHWPHGHLPW